MFIIVLSAFLIIGLTEATLVELENKFFDKSLSIIFVTWESIILAALFTIFTGILPGPLAFFGFKCVINLLISVIVAGSMVKSLSSYP